MTRQQAKNIGRTSALLMEFPGLSDRPGNIYDNLGMKFKSLGEAARLMNKVILVSELPRDWAYTRFEAYLKKHEHEVFSSMGCGPAMAVRPLPGRDGQDAHVRRRSDCLDAQALAVVPGRYWSDPVDALPRRAPAVRAVPSVDREQVVPGASIE